MKKKIVEILSCPKCSGDIALYDVTSESDGEVIEGSLVCQSCNIKYPISKGVPRFVDSDQSYTSSFGLQWNEFAETQQDYLNGTGIFVQRWINIVGESPEEISNKLVLDAGCGSGTFVGVVSNYCKEIIAIDRSSAVDACFKLHGKKHNVHVIQGDIFNLPVKDKIADITYSIGVLQHTPNPKEAFSSLLKKAKPNGKVVIWNYVHRWWVMFSPRMFWRFLVSRLSAESSYKFIRIYVPIMLGLRRLVRAIPVVGQYFQKFIFVCDYEEIYKNLSESQLYEWSLLDTYDALATKYEIRLKNSEYEKVAISNHFSLYDRGWDVNGYALRFKGI